MDVIIKQLKGGKYKITEKYDNTGKLLTTSREFLGKKTVWDWLQLVIIPFVLLVVGSGFSYEQNLTNSQIAQQQHNVDLKIVHDQQQEATLKTYLDDMSDLMISNNVFPPLLLQANKTDGIRKVAQAKTEVALENLDAKYKADVMVFLHKAGLINWHNISSTPISNESAFPLVVLDYDDLSGIDLSGNYMTNVDMRDTLLRNANMNGSILAYDNLSISVMQNINLSDTSLHGVDLHGSDLAGANLSRALLNCDSIAVGKAALDWNKLQVCPNLNGVNLTNAILKGTNLKGVNLSSVNLTSANLSGALLNCNIHQGKTYCVNLSSPNLSGVDLSKANLKGAVVDTALLEKEAKSLKGAIMPDGSIHP
ncbi:MAG: pentapeptide repeat-containing protein [Ktedonobacteraceae bacterium]|nr:pentapeptide repeat-containing protein [Ktedonobacteraceae bacterium]